MSTCAPEPTASPDLPPPEPTEEDAETPIIRPPAGRVRRIDLSQQRGFTLIETLFALFALVLAVGIFLAVMTIGGHGLARTAAAMRQANIADSIEDKLTMSAASAVAVYTPSVCAGANAHGDNEICSQVRFYGKDAANTDHFWGYEYTAASNTVRECLSYPTADAACGQYGVSMLGVLAFSATPTPTTSNPIALQLAYIPVSREYEMRDTNNANDDPNGRVVAGNRVVAMHIADRFANREIHLQQGGAPFSSAVLKGAYVLPAIGTLTAAPNPLTFTNPSAPAQTVTGTETNYADYTATMPGPYWTVSTCIDTLHPGQQDATIAFPAAGAGSGSTQAVTVTPSQSGTCHFTISTLDQNVVVTVTVDAVPGYLLTVSALPQPYLLIGGTETFTASATLQPAPPGQTYPGTPPATIPVGISAETGTCTETPAGTQPSGTTFTVKSGAIYEVCTATVSATAPPGYTVVNNNQVINVAVYEAAAYTLVVQDPLPTSINIGQTATITASALLTDPAQAPPGSPTSVPITQMITLGATVCKFTGAAGGVYSYLGIADGTCDIQFSAPLASPTSITKEIGVGAPPCPPGETGNPPNCHIETGCVITGTTMTMDVGGGTCVLSGTAAMSGFEKFCNPITISCQENVVSQTGTDTNPVANYSLLYENGAHGNSDTYSGWYCITTPNGNLDAAFAGCTGITIDFATLPSAALPLRVTFNIVDPTPGPVDGSVGMDFGLFTDYTKTEWQQTAEKPAPPAINPVLLPADFLGYQTELANNGYLTTYPALDQTTQSFWMTWLAVGGTFFGFSSGASSGTFNYTVTVQQGAGVVGGVYITETPGVPVNGYTANANPYPNQWPYPNL